MTEKLTERDFWIKYWESKPDLVKEVPLLTAYDTVFDKVLKNNQISTTIELGGFPGHFSIFLKKKYQIQPTLLDYVIHEKMYHEILRLNEFTEEDIPAIEADLFQF